MLGISLRHLGFSNFVSEKIYIYIFVFRFNGISFLVLSFLVSTCLSL